MSTDRRISHRLLIASAMTLALSVASPTLCMAQDGGLTVGALSRVQSQTVLLKAKGARAAAAVDLASKDATLSAGRPRNTTGMPEVVGIFGSRELYATLSYSNGLRVNAQAGDVVPGGLRVVSVSQDGVRLEPIARHHARAVASTAQD